MVLKKMNTVKRFFLLFMIIETIFNAQGQSITDNEFSKCSINMSIKALPISYSDSSKSQWAKQEWQKIITKSTFTDDETISKNKIQGCFKVINIFYANGVVDIILSMDSLLYEVLTIANDSADLCSEEIQVGKIYSISLFPYFNYQYTLSYQINEPIYLDGYEISIVSRILHSHIYISPDIKGSCYARSQNADRDIFKLTRY